MRFGLGQATMVTRLTIHWPSGVVQELADIPVGRHIRVVEGQPGFKVLVGD